MARTRGAEGQYYRKLMSAKGGGEQNFLSYYFAGKAQGIDVRFNMQLHGSVPTTYFPWKQSSLGFVPPGKVKRLCSRTSCSSKWWWHF